MFKTLFILLFIAFSNTSYANQRIDNINNQEIDKIIKQKRVEDFKKLVNLWKDIQKWNNF